jgi:hypothetical protein
VKAAQRRPALWVKGPAEMPADEDVTETGEPVLPSMHGMQRCEIREGRPVRRPATLDLKALRPTGRRRKGLRQRLMHDCKRRGWAERGCARSAAHESGCPPKSGLFWCQTTMRA